MSKTSKERTTGFRVVSISYPSGGCYRGQDLDEDYIEACTTRKVVGEYATKGRAIAAARRERDSTCEFEDWAEDYYEDKPPPYYSCDGENYDDDENVIIEIVDIAHEVAAKKKQALEDEKALVKARSSKAPRKTKPKTTGERKFGPQKGNFQPDSRYILGGDKKTDRLEGTKMKKMSWEMDVDW